VTLEQRYLGGQEGQNVGDIRDVNWVQLTHFRAQYLSLVNMVLSQWASRKTKFIGEMTN
jgi:hypothetical protein